MTSLAVRCLHNLDHRGAKADDGTGDGAGLMTRIPHRLFVRELDHLGVEAPPEGRIGVMMTFLASDHAVFFRELIRVVLEAEDLRLLAWRRVPVDPGMLGDRARATMPLIEQALIAAGDSVADQDEFERRLLLARKAVYRATPADLVEAYHVASSSCRVIVYKGLFTASRIERFYWDLRDPSFETDFAVFHQRYSTNTAPSWSLAQPFRMVAHNGEINTIASNRAWMAAREADAGADVWRGRVVDLTPFVSLGRSDSGTLDNVFELLVRSGRSLTHAKEMLIPPAWENVPDLDDDLKSFYEYHAFLSEPWDGPTAMAASDGVTVLAGVDRNGLRPARWMVNPDVVLVASEAGVAPEEEIRAEATGQLGPGETLDVDLPTGEVRFSSEIKRHLSRRRPYADWIRTETVYVKVPFDEYQDDRFDADALARVFGYTAEERRLVLTPMAEGRPAMGAMGNDTPLAAMSERGQRLSRYFHQMFAQVTNPPMDPIREKLMMSLRTYLGRRGSLLSETAEQAHLMELASPILSDADLTHIVESPDPAFSTVRFDVLFDVSAGPGALRASLLELTDQAVAAVRDGATILVLSDMAADEAHVPVPMLLAVGAVHHRLIEEGLRLRASIVAVSGESRDEHDIACLVAYGASAVNPYLAIEQVRSMAADGVIDGGVVEAQEKYRSQLEVGLLKILSKMGICTISAYRGSELFEVIGLDSEVTDLAFRFTSRRVGGLGMEHLARAAIERHARYVSGDQEPEGYYKHRRGGPRHVLSPKAVLALQKAVRSGGAPGWDLYLEEVQKNQPPAQLRDLMAFADRTPVPLEEVESIDRIMQRFTAAAMSVGALSTEAHEAIALAMSELGALSNSGEGGEDSARFGTRRNSKIKQVSTGRFGVTPAYLASAEEFQIKMAQGSKPGEGGQLPGMKVTEHIARLRNTEPGTSLISPPPHHDIYSIEDLAQLVYDLKTFSPLARVSVKLVSEPGVGVISVGVAKAQADVIVVSGHEGGSGASPLVSTKHAGSPWEIGLTETHQTLAENGLRSRVILEVDGGIRTGRDVVVAALLGAERFGFGTLPLLAMGCKMVRQCHEDTCPVGIATQREDLRAEFKGAPAQIVTMFRLLAGEVRRHLAALGAGSLDEIVGRTDLLQPVEGAHPVAASLDALLAPVGTRYDGRHFRPFGRSPVDDVLVNDAQPAITSGTRIRSAYPVSNVDRAVGTRLSGAVTEHHPEGLPAGTIKVRLAGTAGQSLGAFLNAGIEIRLEGAANDYVGKGLGGGSIAIVPSHAEGSAVPHAAGNAVLYGATSGRMFVAGTVGQRFAVRNSGADAVVEGCGDHGCEYMTGGRVAILGPIGRNTAAGMTGGVLFLWDPGDAIGTCLSETAPTPTSPAPADLEDLHSLLSAHVEATGSTVGSALLADWEATAAGFKLLRP